MSIDLAYKILEKAWTFNCESSDYPDFDDICEALAVIKTYLVFIGVVYA